MYTDLDGYYSYDSDNTAPPLVLDIPYNYTPYPFQEEAWEAKKSGKTRFLFLWHRRAGKDKTMWNMFLSFIVDDWDTPGLYFYCLPTGTQARKVIWNGIDNDGFRFIDHIPEALIKSKNGTDMMVELINGSIIQLVGSDNYDRLVGSNPKGICFSEYSISNPLGYDFMRPVLNRNGGWAMFPYTARGKNHGHRLYLGALKNEHKWFVSRKDISQTTDHDGNALIREEDLQEERDLGMSEQMIKQEYYNDFDVATIGAYYGDQLESASTSKRVGVVPIQAGLPVLTSWDLGRSDSTAIWFYQVVGKEIRVIDYYENRLQDIDYYIDVLTKWQVTNKCKIRLCILPHDGKHKTILSNLSAEQRLEKAGYKVDIAPGPSKVSRMDGINSVRAIFSSLWFDVSRCEVGLSCLASYKSKYDPDKNKYLDEPDHDWTSHGADSMRMFAVWWYSGNNSSRIVESVADTRRRQQPIRVTNNYGGN